MRVFVVIREDQSELGYIDTSIVGLFTGRDDAERTRQLGERSARDERLRIEGDPGVWGGDWQVSYRLEEHELS
jgi:hypothetical protein